MTTLTTSELQQRLGDPQLTIVDIRPLAAYNGWRLGGEARGGHIPGAVAFPAVWLHSVDEQEVGRLLDAKRITADREIVVYGAGPDDATEFVAALRDARPRRRPDRSMVAPRRGPPTRRCRSSVCPATSRSSTSRGSATCWPVAGRRHRPTRRSCSSTSTSACPRSTPRGTSPGRTTSTRTGSRIRPTGTAARPTRSRRHWRHSGSPATPRWCCTAATPRVTRTRSGRADGPARSPRPGRS